MYEEFNMWPGGGGGVVQTSVINYLVYYLRWTGYKTASLNANVIGGFCVNSVMEAVHQVPVEDRERGA